MCAAEHKISSTSYAKLKSCEKKMRTKKSSVINVKRRKEKKRAKPDVSFCFERQNGKALFCLINLKRDIRSFEWMKENPNFVMSLRSLSLQSNVNFMCVHVPSLVLGAIPVSFIVLEEQEQSFKPNTRQLLTFLSFYTIKNVPFYSTLASAWCCLLNSIAYGCLTKI